MASDLPIGMDCDLPGFQFATEPALEPHLPVAPAVIGHDTGCCCQPVVECCDSGTSEHIDTVAVELTAGLNAHEWEGGVEGTPATTEIVVVEELVGEAVSVGEIFAGEPGQGEGAVVGEAGSSVLVEPAAPLEAPTPLEPTESPVVHDPLQMDAPKALQPLEPEAEPVVPVPEQVSPPAPPEPVNIFEAEEGEASLEPARRWIHARGDRSLVARLVGMPDAETCLLETANRRIRVPLESLSQHDQGYVQRAGERLSAARAAAQSLETAGL